MGEVTGSIHDRQCFRLDAEMEIYYRPATIQEQQTQNFTTTFSEQKRSNLSQALNSLSQDAKFYLQAIDEENPTLSNYLRIIENKMALITQAIENPEEVHDNDHNLIQMANISETGIGFGTNEQLDKNQLFRLRLVLRPSYQAIEAYGIVVKSTEAKDNQQIDDIYPYWTTFHFSQLASGDQQLLSKYILYQQRKK